MADMMRRWGVLHLMILEDAVGILARHGQEGVAMARDENSTASASTTRGGGGLSAFACASCSQSMLSHIAARPPSNVGRVLSRAHLTMASTAPSVTSDPMIAL